jgi:hypothetical protein
MYDMTCVEAKSRNLDHRSLKWASGYKMGMQFGRRLPSKVAGDTGNDLVKGIACYLL